MSFIQKLQNKPRPARVAIMWVSVTICMAILFVFWVWSMAIGRQKIQSAGQTAEQTSDNSGVAASLENQVPTLWQNIKESMKGLFESSSDNSVQAPAEQPAEQVNQKNQSSQESLPVNNQETILPAELP